jgi:hypothetical protein
VNGSAAGRIPGVLVSPVKTFRAIAERPTWWPPLLVLILLFGGIGYVLAQRMDFEDVVRQRIAKQGQEVSAEQIDRGVQMAKRFAPFGAVASALVFWPAVFLILALILWTVFRLLGSELSYPASFSVTVHSMIPLAVAQLLALPVVLSRDKISAHDAQDGILLSNLAFLTPEGAGPAVRALLGSIDFFALWVVVLLVVGYREVARVSWAKAAAVVAVLWLLIVGLRVGLAAVFG